MSAGRLVLVVGPSGAGKDTLIALARDACKDDPAIVFPRRVVTRPPSPFEDHDSFTGEEFVRAEREGRFALSWEAHGHRYGIPIGIEEDLRAGRTVVCNVSRAIVGAAARRWPVTIVFVTAPPEVLAARLASRSRTSDGLALDRLNRTADLDAGICPDLVIENVGAPEEGAGKLLAAIRDQSDLRDFHAELLF
ncbi:MAG: phosphonate metabolism protein/1,5-bisphosphokinase (PRPP-forming) PhnN [Bradyrhizobiaceae bacterium]|nr:phosphonate metabolism protein/1,5-bisphosphokinase (PRPP-forming) PhnN [Bradyrhizobiaceae bacterium]